MTDITIQDNGDGTGTITIAGVPITPYTAPIVSPPPPPPPPPPSLTAGFTAVVDQDGCTVHFHDTSAGAAKAQWSWGDGGTSMLMGDQDKVYRNAKTYTVKQIVWDANGKTQTFSANVTTTAGGTPSSGGGTPTSPPPPPAIDASTDVPTVIADGQSILYHYPLDVTHADEIDHVEIPGEFGSSPTVVQKIAWNFGDGTNGWGADGRHPYDKPGTYTITGSVSMKDGTITPFGPLTVTVGA